MTGIRGIIFSSYRPLPLYSIGDLFTESRLCVEGVLASVNFGSFAVN